jgi:hypothetical protein
LLSESDFFVDNRSEFVTTGNGGGIGGIAGSELLIIDDILMEYQI